jgi:glycosyltransferase involved in cell wall biosynthesis
VDYGGAGTAAYRLHKHFSTLGHDSRMLVLDSRVKDASVTEATSNSFRKRVVTNFHKAWLRARTNQDYFFQDERSTPIKLHRLMKYLEDFRPDIIVAHSLTYFFTLRQLLELQQVTRAPILWYLLDMAPFTGGCHYAWDCSGYARRCGRCPAFGSSDENDLSRRGLSDKLDAIRHLRLAVVAGSGLLQRQASRSALFDGRCIDKILLAVEPAVFKPGPKKDLRRKLGLPADKKIVFFGAHKVSLRRKGMAYLMEALESATASSDRWSGALHFAVAGDSGEMETFLASRFPFTPLGHLHGDEMLASAYAAADFFVCPSVEDSGPMMINESIMCGTPVVSFDMGVAQDLVHSRKTGYRAELKNSADLARGIRYMLDLSAEEARRMSEECRKVGLESCHPTVQVGSFMKLFRYWLDAEPCDPSLNR